MVPVLELRGVEFRRVVAGFAMAVRAVRGELLAAIRERNSTYRAYTSAADENQALAQEVDGLRAQLHRLERDALAAQEVLAAGRHGEASRPDDALRNDALRLSPSLWPRLAFGALQRLSPSDSADFSSAVEAVCATAKDWGGAAAADASGARPGVGDDMSGQDVGAGAHSGEELGFTRAERGEPVVAQGAELLTLGDVVSQFATHIVLGMLSSGSRVDLRRLRAHEDHFRRMLLEVCWQGAASTIPVSKDLAEQDRKRGTSVPPSMRTLMSEELLETHEKLAVAEQSVFASQAELFEAYRKLAASGKETAALRKQIVTLQGELSKAHKELNEEVGFFRQVQEENRVQAAIIKGHAPQVLQLKNEIRALKEERSALERKVYDLEDLVLMIHEGQETSAQAVVSLSKLAYTAADRLAVVMDKRNRETCSLESLLSLAMAATPQSPSGQGHEHTPKDEEEVEEEAAGPSPRRVGMDANTALGGMEGWAREALQEAAADLRRIVQDVEGEYESEARGLEVLLQRLEPQLARHQALVQQLQSSHSAAAATLARVRADRSTREQRLSLSEADAHDAALAAAAAEDAVAAGAGLPSAAAAAGLQRRNRSMSLDAAPGPNAGNAHGSDSKAKSGAAERKGSSFSSASRVDSPSSSGGIGMSFSTGHDGFFYITGLRPGSPAALCGLLQVRWHAILDACTACFVGIPARRGCILWHRKLLFVVVLLLASSGERVGAGE